MSGVLPGDLELQRGLGRRVLGERAEDVGPVQQRLAPRGRRRQIRRRLLEAAKLELRPSSARAVTPSAAASCTRASACGGGVVEAEANGVEREARLRQLERRDGAGGELPLEQRDVCLLEVLLSLQERDRAVAAYRSSRPADTAAHLPGDCDVEPRRLGELPRLGDPVPALAAVSIVKSRSSVRIHGVIWLTGVVEL